MKTYLPDMQAIKDNGLLGPVVVVHLGTNGSFSDETLAQMMAILADVPVVVVLTSKADREWVEATTRRSCAFSGDPSERHRARLGGARTAVCGRLLLRRRHPPQPAGPELLHQPDQPGARPRLTSHRDPTPGAGLPGSAWVAHVLVVTAHRPTLGGYDHTCTRRCHRCCWPDRLQHPLPYRIGLDARAGHAGRAGTPRRSPRRSARSKGSTPNVRSRPAAGQVAHNSEFVVVLLSTPADQDLAIRLQDHAVGVSGRVRDDASPPISRTGTSLIAVMFTVVVPVAVLCEAFGP